MIKLCNPMINCVTPCAMLYFFAHRAPQFIIRLCTRLYILQVTKLGYTHTVGSIKNCSFQMEIGSRTTLTYSMGENMCTLGLCIHTTKRKLPLAFNSSLQDPQQIGGTRTWLKEPGAFIDIYQGNKRIWKKQGIYKT